ncbi:MAG: hypothetical protein LBL87_01335 [Ruminococcus sp.]|nr:hypothetical protein [Ruminococcus sp.]
MREVLIILLVFAFILATIIVPIVIFWKVMMNSAQKRITGAAERQKTLQNAVQETLKNTGFNIDKSIYIQMPTERFDLKREWIPAIDCFLYVDDKNKKWAIAQRGSTTPKIFNYSDFTGFDVEVNGKNAGNTQNNAIVGFIFGGLIGAAAGAMFTKRYGTIKQMTMKIRVNDLQNPVIEVPVITAPLNGFNENDKGLPFIMTFASNVEQTFGYINDNKYAIANL